MVMRQRRIKRIKGVIDRPPSNAAELSESERILDRLIRNHALFLGEQEHNIRGTKATLRRTSRQLENRLRRLTSRDDLTLVEQKQLKAMLADLRRIRARGAVQYQKAIERQGIDIATARTADLTEALEGAGVAFGRQLSPDQIATIARGDIAGATTKEWFTGGQAAQAERLERSIRLAFAEGASIGSVVAELRRQEGGNRRQLETLARTVMQGFANEAAHNLYDRNSELLTGKQWIATLDDNTSLCCGPLDGRIWFYEGTPNVDNMPRAPKHPNCRCFVAPVVKGLSRPNVPTWPQWIPVQNKATQLVVLGPTRRDLLNEGLITPRQLTRANGTIRPVSELLTMVQTERKAA